MVTVEASHTALSKIEGRFRTACHLSATSLGTATKLAAFLDQALMAWCSLKLWQESRFTAAITTQSLARRSIPITVEPQQTTNLQLVQGFRAIFHLPKIELLSARLE